MPNDNIVPIHPHQPSTVHFHPLEVDDSRLQTIWARHHRRSTIMVAGLAATATLLGIAAIIAALRFNSEPTKIEVKNEPPTITVPAPVVNFSPNIEVKVPEQKTTNPNQVPRLPIEEGKARPGETGKAVTEYRVFHTATNGGKDVVTGWAYRKSTDEKPYEQYCYVRLGPTTILDLADDGKPNLRLADEAVRAGVSPADAHRWVTSCRWHG